MREVTHALDLGLVSYLFQDLRCRPPIKPVTRSCYYIYVLIKKNLEYFIIFIGIFEKILEVFEISNQSQ